ncbi:MAG: hypothetical protein B7Z73_15240, partial [Planctomycetia bacterium 21-64-5]
MPLDQLRRYLDSPAEAEAWLRSWGLNDPGHAHASLLSMATAGLTLDLLDAVCNCLADQLPQTS